MYNATKKQLIRVYEQLQQENEDLRRQLEAGHNLPKLQSIDLPAPDEMKRLIREAERLNFPDAYYEGWQIVQVIEAEIAEYHAEIKQLYENIRDLEEQIPQTWNEGLQAGWNAFLDDVFYPYFIPINEGIIECIAIASIMQTASITSLTGMLYETITKYNPELTYWLQKTMQHIIKADRDDIFYENKFQLGFLIEMKQAADHFLKTKDPTRMQNVQLMENPHFTYLITRRADLLPINTHDVVITYIVNLAKLVKDEHGKEFTWGEVAKHLKHTLQGRPSRTVMDQRALDKLIEMGGGDWKAKDCGGWIKKRVSDRNKNDKKMSIRLEKASSDRPIPISDVLGGNPF